MNENGFINIAGMSGGTTGRDNKNGKIWIVLTIVELVIIGVLACLLATTNFSGSNNVEEDENKGIADLDERKSLVIDGSDAFIAAWSASKDKTARLSKANCESIIALSNKYAEEYNTQALGADFCAANSIIINTWMAQSENYPFSEMRFMKIGNNKSHVVLELNASFTLVDSYSYANSAGDGVTVTIVEG